MNWDAASVRVSLETSTKESTSARYLVFCCDKLTDDFVTNLPLIAAVNWCEVQDK